MKAIATSLVLTLVIIASGYAQKPKATYQLGASKVTVWIDTIKTKDSTYTVKNFEIEKVYKKNNEWKSTNHFNEEELLKLRAAIDKAINEEIVRKKE